MVRVKRGSVARERRHEVLTSAKGFRGAHSNLFRVANQQVFKSRRYSYVGRKRRKRDFKRIWMSRINGYLYRLNRSLYLLPEVEFRRRTYVTYTLELPEHYGGLDYLQKTVPSFLCRLNYELPYTYTELAGISETFAETETSKRLCSQPYPRAYFTVFPDWRTREASGIDSIYLPPGKRRDVFVVHQEPIGPRSISSRDGSRIRSFGDVMRCLGDRKSVV